MPAARSPTTDAELLAASFAVALETGTWSVADVALVDDLAARVGPVKEKEAEERGFYEIEELDDLTQYGVTEVQPVSSPEREDTSHTRSADPRERLLAGRIGKPDDYAHVLVDEAQDLSPMQWRMIGLPGTHRVVDRRRRRRAGVLARRRRGRGSARGGLRSSGAPALPHGHQLPQRSRDLRLRRRDRAA